MINRNQPAPANSASLVMLILLLAPMGTLVLAVYFFSRLAGELADRGFPEATALKLLGTGAGLSSILAVLALICLLVTYRQRNRLSRANRRLTEMLNLLMDEKGRMARSHDALACANAVVLAIKTETSFERIAGTVLEQLGWFSKATDIVVFALANDGELDPCARRLNGIDTFGSDIDRENLECELAYEAQHKQSACRVLESRTGNYAVAIPYATQEGTRGVVLLRRNVIDDPDFEQDLPHFEQALVHLVRSVSVGLKFAALWDRAIKDEMTGLYNKNHFNSEMPKLMSATLRKGKPFTLIMLDVDKFKHINDQFGHIPGDMILRQVSAIMIESLRDTDLAFRYGGEELCVVCGNTVADNAGKFAERLRQIIAHTEFRTDAGQLIPVSASFGVAEFDPREMTDCEDLKKACDRALYYAKEHGRNQVVMFRGNDQFEPIERGGDVSTEVKERLGLAGDNTPLEDATSSVDRRAEPQSGKVGEAIAEGIVAAPVDSMVMNPGRSMKLLAQHIIAVAHEDSRKLAEVAQIAGMTAAAMTESRRVADIGECKRKNDDRRTEPNPTPPDGKPDRRTGARRTASQIDNLPGLEDYLKDLLEQVSTARQAVARVTNVSGQLLDAVTEVKAEPAAKPKRRRAPRRKKLESVPVEETAATATESKTDTEAQPSPPAKATRRRNARRKSPSSDEIDPMPVNQSARLFETDSEPESEPASLPVAETEPNDPEPVAEPSAKKPRRRNNRKPKADSAPASAPVTSSLSAGWEPKRKW